MRMWELSEIECFKKNLPGLILIIPLCLATSLVVLVCLLTLHYIVSFLRISFVKMKRVTRYTNFR